MFQAISLGVCCGASAFLGLWLTLKRRSRLQRERQALLQAVRNMELVDCRSNS